MYKLFLTLRYLRRRRIAYFAIAAVTLCVMMVLVVMSIMGGWLDEVKQRSRGLLGDVIIDNGSYSGFPLYQEFIDEISAWPDVVAAAPIIYTYGLYKFEDFTINGMVRIVGLRLEDVYEVNAFKSSLFYEKHYPGTTTLAPQRQPFLSIDYDAPPIQVIEDGQSCAYRRPILPPEYQAALEKSRAAGGIEDDSTVTELNRLLARMSLPPIPGVYDGPLAPEDQAARETNNELPGVIIGRDMIAERESDGRYKRPEYLPRGCKMILTLWAASVSGNVDPIPIKQAFRYSDDSRTGIYEIDSQHVYCDFNLLQKLLQMDQAERIDPETGATIGVVPARCYQIQIKLAPGLSQQRIHELCRKMENTYQAFIVDDDFNLDVSDSGSISRIKALTWQESQAHIIGPVEKERILVTMLFAIISLVAVTLVLCILYMIVLQKTRDIGIVKSIGGSSGGAAFIFVLYGAAVGVAGSVLGSILGVLFVKYVNEIQDFLIRLNPAWRMWDMKVYSFDRIPSHVAGWDIVFVVVFAILASTFGSFVAAWRAGRMPPVEAVRYE